MSGIGGVFRRDAGPADAGVIANMVATLAHRGPDRSLAVCSGPVAFAHTMLWTTPESLTETLPLRDDRSDLMITADARIDNREELIAQLKPGRPAAEISDSELILGAYEKWGEQCPDRLIGDFAFAIWDGRKQLVFCARDAMGIKGMYYYVSPGIFVFGSEIKALFCAPETPKRLNELRILDYLANLIEDRAITFYQEINRLPAGSTLTITRSGVKLEAYWTLDPHKELKLSSDAEYTEAFRECFVETVRARMRSAFPVGSALSGGLDSSSIACVARTLNRSSQPIHTFSLIFPSSSEKDLRLLDERRYIQEALQGGGFQPHYVHADELSPMMEVERVQQHCDEAFFAGNLYLHWAMYEAASRAGARVFLDGLDGDTTVSHGFEHLADLLLGLRFKTLLREVNLLAENLQLPKKLIVREFCIKPVCPTWAYTLWRKMRGRPNATLVPDTFMTEDFKARLNLEGRVKTLLHQGRSCTRSAREKHMDMIRFPLYAHALELVDKAAAAFHLEARYPFFDRRLLEFCLALPARQKLAQGWSRFILRKAMAGILPEAIRWRPSKADLTPNFCNRFLDRDRPWIDEVLSGKFPGVTDYLDLARLERTFKRYGADPMRNQGESVPIFGAVNLAVWLHKAGVRP
jgi:asparagine synthase (glutamine-hydrolysing)